MRCAFSYIFLLFCLFPGAELVFAGQARIDSLLKLLSTDKQDTIRIDHMCQLCWDYQLSGRYKEAKKMGQEALDSAENKKYNKGIASAYNNLGVIEYQLGNYSPALEYYFAALKVNDKAGNKGWMIKNYNNIGLIYYLENNPQEALKTYSLALDLSRNANDSNSISQLYNNIGLVQQDLLLFDEALVSFEKALQINLRRGNKDLISKNYGNLGNIFLDKKDYTRSLKYQMLSLKMRKEMKDLPGMASAYLGVAALLMNTGKYDRSKKYIDSSLTIALKTGRKDNTMEAYIILYTIDSLMKDSRSELDDYSNYILYRDSLLSEENIKKTVETEMQYAFDKKQAEDSLSNFAFIQQEQLKHDQAIKQQRIFTLGGIAGFLMMLIVTLISYRAYRLKQKSNDVISIQKSIVDKKQKEILDSIYYAKRIQDSLLPKDKYFEKMMNKNKSI